ncbi:MAG TPA: Yip1 family protein [Thermoanaerobaculia bacterium]|nr:Yip1 family protein [Thermoanaerobaculia bacterium]
MSMTDAGPLQPSPASEPKPSALRRFGGVLTSPGETFESIARRPDVLVPLLLILGLSFVTGIIVARTVDFTAVAREAMEANPQAAGLPPEQAERSLRFMANLWKVLAYASPLFSLIMFAVIAGVLSIAFRLFGGEGTYKQAFSVTLYSWLPMLIKGIIATAVFSSRRSVTMAELQNPVRSNLAFLVDFDTRPVAFAILSSVDVFTIWTLVLFVIGFAAISKCSRAKSAAIVVSLWLVMLLFKVGGAAMQAMRIKSS